MDTYSLAFVCLMGMGTVFLGLICIIALCCAMSALIRRMKGRAPVPPPKAEPSEPVDGALVAAISAAIAEDLGTDISAIRILSIRKV